MKKFLLSFAVCLAALPLLAQKPITVAVMENPATMRFESFEGDSRVASLVLEYYKSELATHAGLKIADIEVVDEALEKNSIQIGEVLSEAKIKSILSDAGSSVLCLQTLERKNESDYIATFHVYGADGKLKGKTQRLFKTIKTSDLASVAMARETALIIRGVNPVDKVNFTREQELKAEIEGMNASFEKTEKKKSTLGRKRSARIDTTVIDPESPEK